MRGIVAAAALLLASCAAVPPPGDDDGLGLDARRQALTARPDWELRGRIAIDTGDEAFQARLRWRQQGDELLLSVRGPFGAGSFEISGTPPVLTVRGRGETWRLNDAEHQLSAWLGWWLPVTSLPDWLRGLPDASAPIDATRRRGNVLAMLDQRDWRTDYGRYALAEGLLLPHEIAFRHGRLRIELTADEWRLTP